MLIKGIDNQLKLYDTIPTLERSPPSRRGVNQENEMLKVITYTSANGATINLTPKEIKAHEKAGTWPRDARGAEYCTVSHGLHYGRPTSDASQDYDESEE